MSVELLDRFLGSPASILSLASSDRAVTRATTSERPVDRNRELPLSDGVLGHVLERRGPRIVDDFEETRTTATATPDSESRYRSGLFVPIEEWGVIVAADEAPGAFDDADLAVAELVAEVVEPYLVGGRGRGADRFPAEERLEEIASVLSHDLPGPIRIARSWVQHAIETGETDRLEDAERAIDRIDGLTGSLERYARTGRPIEEPRVVDLQTTATSAWSVVRAEDAELDVVDSISMLADESRLLQLFDNLFRNAVVHGAPPVTVRVGPLDGRPGFFVEDNGDGIPQQNREAVLEYGYSTTEDRSGYGLGIVAGIVEAHGWKIDVGESVDGGARFEVFGVDLA